jgi:hypothetical protein
MSPIAKAQAAPADLFPIETMCIAAKKALAAHINRSAGQHLRAMRKTSALAKVLA